MSFSTWENLVGVADNYEEPAAKVIITGDWAPIRHFNQVMLDNPVGIYGDTLEVLRSADYRITNLECAMAGTQPILKAGPNLQGTGKHFECFMAGGFDMALQSNNHVCDFGHEALFETMRLLDERGVKHIGAGRNLSEAWEPAVIEVKGVKIGVVTFGDNYDFQAAEFNKPGSAGQDVNMAVASVRRLKPVCDAVITIYHGGIEYQPYPMPSIRRDMLLLADSGADAVICHHPHAPQGIEIHNGVPIFYSLGNFVFYQPWMLFHRKQGILLELDFSKSGVKRFELHPFAINDNGVHLLKGRRLEDFKKLMKRISEPFPNRAEEAWHAFLKYSYEHDFAPYPMQKNADRLVNDPKLFAATLLSYFSCRAHQEHKYGIVSRVVNGTIDDAPAEFYDMVKEYLERPVEEDM